jgi:phosphate transport system substrate-binding protein
MLRKTLTLVVVLGLLAALLATLAGCPAQQPTPPPPAPTSTAPPPPPAGGAAAAGTITETGSTTVLPIAQKWQAAFNKLHPDIKIDVSGGGSGTGIKALIS